jgi:uncharacterized membrane protein YhfC
MPQTTLDYEAREVFDTGRFTARYLQALAGLSIAWMIVGPFITHSFNLDLSFIFLLWAASAVRRHSPLARKWVLIVCGFGLILCGLLVVQSFAIGTTHITVNFFRPIHNPSRWQVLGVSFVIAIVTGIPFCILLSHKARQQFARRSGGA